MKTAIIYGSTTGNTKAVAEQLQQKFDNSEIIDAASLDPADLKEYDLLICGTSTWGLGELQDDWDQVLKGVTQTELTGKKVAFFGLGDQIGYPDTFVDAIAALHLAFTQAGATIIGRWLDSGYDYDTSAAAADGYFLGLALDEDNQSRLTKERLQQWSEQLKAEV